MEFDITHLDKKVLVQTLFMHSEPLGYGRNEYNFRKQLNDNVDGLTDDECEIILDEYNAVDIGTVAVLDYHKGKPMKLYFLKQKGGRVLVDSSGYDSRNGKYRFLEALLNIFSLDEILITKKGYKQYIMEDLPEHLLRPKEQDDMFRFVINNTKEMKNKFGKHWIIDENKVKYKSAFMVD